MSDHRPDHYTAISTRKFQAQGRTEWSKTFKEIAKLIGGAGAAEGIGIRACLMGGLKLAASASGKAELVKLGQHIEAELQKDRAALQVKIAKRPEAKERAKKAKKVATAKAKNAKKEIPAS